MSEDGQGPYVIYLYYLYYHIIYMPKDLLMSYIYLYQYLNLQLVTQIDA